MIAVIGRRRAKIKPSDHAARTRYRTVELASAPEITTSAMKAPITQPRLTGLPASLGDSPGTGALAHPCRDG